MQFLVGQSCDVAFHRAGHETVGSGFRHRATEAAENKAHHFSVRNVLIANNRNTHEKRMRERDKKEKAEAKRNRRKQKDRSPNDQSPDHNSSASDDSGNQIPPTDT